MKITNGAFVRKSLAVFSAAISLIAFISCGEDTGLGSTIDTEAPKIAISYPNPKVSNVARDEFVLAGTCSDDKLISRVQVAVTNLDTQTSYGTFPATLDAKSNTWSVKLNTFDASNEDNCNGYPFPDGNYKFVATAYDNAGHSTQDTSSFEIDNTAPVVVLTSPGSVTTATEYGSSFYVEGTIAEEHTVSSLKVTIYDEAGNVLDQTDVTPYIESDIATSGGTNVSFMKFSTGSSTLRERYKNIYGDNENAGTKNYTCAIYVSDNAKEFKNPNESTSDDSGNETSVFYLYSDVYKTLMSANGYGLTAADLMRIINGSYTASDDDSSRNATASSDSGLLTKAQLAEVKAILSKKGQYGYDSEKSKATDTSENHLKFSLNPKVNPTYTISGLSIEEGSKSYPSGTKNQTITFILSPGLDGTAIEAATVKAYLLKYKPVAEVNENGLSEDDYSSFLGDPEKFESEQKILVADLSEKYKDTMLTSLTATFKLPEIVANYFYVVALSGVDADEHELVPDGLFGFVGALSGTPPSVTIETPISQSIIGDSKDVTFTGKVVTTEVKLESLAIEIDVSNVETGDTLTTENKKITASGSGKDGDSVTWGEPVYDATSAKYTYEWTCNLKDCENYSEFSAEAKSEHIYSYAATVKATDTSGNTNTTSRTISVDTVPPKITINSILPSVTDYTDATHTDKDAVYANGSITVSGSIEEMNLKSASYTVLVNGETVKKDGGEPDEKYTDVTIYSQFKITIDTTKLIDDSDFKIVIAAEDRANSSNNSLETELSGDNTIKGNYTSYSTAEYYAESYDKDQVPFKILQETDRPVISLTNANASISNYAGIKAAVEDDEISNIFTAGGTLNAMVSDDDGVKSVTVECSKDGTNYTKRDSKYSASNNTLSVKLPSDYGEYNIRITAKDTNGLSSGTAESEFYIAIDDGVPTFSSVSPTDNFFCNDTFDVSGTVKDASGEVTLTLKDSANGTINNVADATGTSALVSENTAVKTGVQFKDTIKVPEASNSYTLTYVATDKYLQSKEYTILYIVDKVVPLLSDFKVFPNGGTLSTKAPTISVKASDSLSGLSKVEVLAEDGTELAQLSGDASTGTYTGTVTLSEGKNSLYVKATDKAGNSTVLPESGLYTVTVDTAAPVISNETLSISEINKEEYDKSSFTGVTVAATIKDSGSGSKYAWLSTSTNGSEYASSSIKSENSAEDLTKDWSVNLSIPKSVFTENNSAKDGQYTYYLYAEDGAGRKTVSSALTFVVDTTAPKITVYVLKDGKKSFTQNDVSDLSSDKKSAKYTLSGTWEDVQTGTASFQYTTVANPSEEDWYVISNTDAANISLSWDKTIDVTESTGNILSFRAKDKAGNISEPTTYSDLIFDFSAPTITVPSTIPSQTKDAVTVTGKVSDSLSISKDEITIKAVKGSSTISASLTENTEGKDYSYSLEILASSENNGTWTVSFEATDVAGQKTTLATRTILIDNTAPVVGDSAVSTTGSTTDSGVTYFNSTYPLSITTSVTDSVGTISEVEYAAYSGKLTSVIGSGTAVIDWTPLSLISGSYKGTASGFINANNGNGIADGEYTIFIRATDSVGNVSALKAVHLVADKTVPAFTVSSDEGKSITTTEGIGAYFEKGIFTISGTLSETNLKSLTYTVNGGAAQDLDSSNGWSISNDSIPEDGGTFAYIITATDKAGSVATVRRTVTIDKVKPEVSVDNWKDSTNTFDVTNKNSSTVTFSGSVKDNDGGSGLDSVTVYYINASGTKIDSTVNPDSTGKWTYTFTGVEAGDYTLHVVAKDNAGNEKVETKAFGVDLATPVVIGSVTSNGAAASTGTDGNYIVNNDFALSGTVNDKAFRAKNVSLSVKKDGGSELPVSVVLKKNNETVSADSTEKVESLDWSYAQTLDSDGLYTYKLTATDDAGNTKESSFIVRVDTTAPTITVLEPVAGANFTPKTGENTTTVNLSGTAFDSGTGVEEVSYKVYLTSKLSNPVSSDVARISNGTWTASVDLENQGNYTLIAKAKDYLGNLISSDAVSFYCDNTAPVLSNVAVTTDKDESYDYYNTRIITITASASDAVSGVRNLTYSLNGGTARTMTLSSGTTAADEIAVYTAEVSCAEGANSIIISATDANGNTTSGDEVKTLTFKVDSVAPSFVATSVSSTESNADVTVRGTITEAQGLHSTNGLKVTATKDGEPVTNETLLNAIQPTYTAGSALSGSAWNFTLTADTTNHSTDGSWVFTITAKDVAGNESTTTASVLIDTVAPTLNNIAATVSYEKPSTTDSITYFNGSKPLFLSIITKDNEGGVGLDNVEYNIVSGHKTKWADTLVTTNSSWNSLSKSNSTDTPADTWKTTIISDFADLDDGAYTIFVRSSDKLGNKKYSTPLLLVNDQTVPTLTESTTVNSNYMAYKESSATNATLSGNVNDKNEDESSAGYFASLTYTLTADISIEETVKSGTITPGANGDWSLTTPNFDTTTGGTFTYNFTAIDKAGNKAEVRRIIVKDLVAPEVLIASLNTITDLTSSNTVNSSNCTFKGTAKDNIELKEVYAYIRANSESDPTDEWIASNKKSFTTDSEHSWEVTFSNVNEDWYTLYVVAKDSAGNENTKTQIFGVDNAAPTTSLTLTANKVKAMSGTSSYDLDASGNYTISGVANKASWDDGVTYIASETFRIGGVVTEKFDFTADDIKLYVNKETTEITKSEISTNETTGVKTLTWYYEQTVSSTEGESDGLYTYKLEATDASGNSQTYQFIVRIDTLGPSTTILSPASGAGINGSSFEISGTASDVGTGVSSVNYAIYNTSDDTESPKSGTAIISNGRWTATVKDVSEGNLRLEATSTDYLGHPSNVTSVEFYYDSTAPSLSDITVTPLESGNTQYNTNSSIEIGVTATDAVSGVANVTYKIGSDGPSRAMTLSNESYVGWPTFTETGTYTIYVDAVDKQNNSTASGETPTSETIEISVDADAPNLVSSSVKIDDSAVQETYYTNGKSDITISGTVTDIGSGIKSVTILPYEKSTTDKITATLGTSSTTDGVTSVPFSKAIDKSKITKSGTVYALIEDRAGNTTYVNLVALTYDATDPKIQSYALSDNKVGYTAYNSGKDSNGNAIYYVNNGNAHSFTLSGIATDNLGLAKAELSIPGVTVAPITDENELSEWSFAIGSLSGMTDSNGSTTATITLTDKAGNTATQNFTIKVDTLAPSGVHDLDTVGKDYTFRLGSGIGGKYSAGTYGNASTIQIRGYFTEEGSGTNLIYYELFNGTAPTAAAATSFLENYESFATGSFATLSSEETNTVPSTAESGNKTGVKTNFKASISGFEEGKNYLLLVAVDKVGNAALDEVTYEYTNDNSASVSVKGCYSINVDNTLPSVVSAVESTILTNGNENIEITGTASDADAGVDGVEVKLTVGTTAYSSTDTDSKITVTTNTETGDTDKNLHWKAVIDSSVFSAETLTSGTFTVYATAIDKAGDGNTQTISVANITVDKVSPTVTLAPPTSADTTSDVRKINGKLDLSGTVKDANPLPSTAIVGIQYAKADTANLSDEDDSGWTTLTNESKGQMSELVLSGDYTFDIKNFDTTKIEPLNDVAYYIRAKATDKAGNIGYSGKLPVTISQDSDRPIIKITNLTDLGESASPRYVLKYGTKSQISAMVSDDDGIDKVYISESEYKGSTGETAPASTMSDYSSTTGNLTFTPSADYTAGKNVDGQKTFYIYVKDTEGKEFYSTYYGTDIAPATAAANAAETAKYLNTPKVKINDTSLSDADNAKAFTYRSDSTSPVVEDIQALAYKSDKTTKNGGAVVTGTGANATTAYTAYESVNASYIIGGTEKEWAQFKVITTDESGIDGIALEIAYTKTDGTEETLKLRSKDSTAIADSNYTVDGADTFITDSNDSKKSTWTTGLIDFKNVKTGSVTIKVIPYDKLGLVGNGNATFVVDNSAPPISITSPASGEEKTGVISIVGNSYDGNVGTDDIQWLVPTKTEVATANKETDSERLEYLRSLKLSDGTSKWNGGLTSLAERTSVSVSSWQFDFDGEYDKETSVVNSYIFKAGNPTLDVYDKTEFASNDDYETTGLYYLPIYFMATDKLGNYSIIRDYVIHHNPDGDKPKLEITYPTKENYDAGKTFATLGGAISVTGSAEIPSGTTTVKNVYLQIASDAGSFDSTDKTKAGTGSGNYGFKVVDAYTVINGIRGTAYNSTDTSGANAMTDDIAKTFGFASKTALDAWWGISVTNTTSWRIQINADNNMNPTGDNDTNPVKIRACGVNANGKFGAWTAGDGVISIHIDNKVPVISAVVKQYAAAITANPTTDPTAVASQNYATDMFLRGENWYLVLDARDESGIDSVTVKNGVNNVAGCYEMELAAVDEKSGKRVYIPIDTSVTALTYTVEAKEIEGTGTGTAHTTKASYSFKIDNNAPSLEDIMNGSNTELSESEKNSVQNSNSVYTIKGTSDDLEEGSGVEHVLFYFMRKSGKTETSISNEVLLDPMISPKTTTTAGVTTTSYGKIALSTLEELSLDKTTEKLYAEKISGKVTADSNGSFNTFTAGTVSGETFTDGANFDEHIRIGGLVKIDGLYRKISSVSGNVVTFSPSATADSSGDAYFPIAQVIDANNTAKKNSDNPFQFETGKDDGDGMPESFTKSGSKWTWDASIHSDNMPDGPATLVVLAFDAAGNVTGKSYSVMVSNNAPRLAKVFLATDLNNNSKYENEEFESYNILDAEGNEQEKYTLNFTSFNEKYASTSEVFTVKNKLMVVPEIVGGNGTMQMVAKKGASSETAVPTSETGAISLSSITSKTAEGTTKASLDSTATITANIFAAAATGNKFWAYELSNEELAGGSPTEPDGETSKTTDDGTGKSFSFTFWDSTEERTQGTNSQNAVLLIEDFTFDLVDGTAPTVVVNPFYWNSLNSNSIYGSADSDNVSSVGDLLGHIELESDWTATDSAGNKLTGWDGNTSGTALDSDPKVSGKITFTGTAYDEHALGSLIASFGTAFSNVEIATYNPANSTWSVAASTIAAGYEVTLSDAGTIYSYDGSAQKTVTSTSSTYGNYSDTAYFGQSGHKVYWTLSVDTSKITNQVGADVNLTVTATDHKGNSTVTTAVKPGTTDGYKVTDGTTNVPTYRMDVVPYVTEVTTSLTTLKSKNPSVFNRTARGHYPVRSDETVTFSGFNLNGNTSLAISELSISAKYDIVVSGISALNNFNNNNARGSYETEISNASSYNIKKNYAYNRQPNNDNNNLLTDDIYFDIWEFNSSAAVPISGKIEQPVMKIRPTDGKIGFAFVNGPLYFSMGGSSTTQDYSYQYWVGSYDFFSSVGFTYDDSGNSWGVAAGGDINSTTGDKFFLASSLLGRGTLTADGSRSGANIIRMERIAQVNDGILDFDKQRVRSPSLATTTHDGNTNLYLAYYDTMNNQLRFKAGNYGEPTLGNENITSYVRKVDRTDNKNRGVWVSKTDNDTLNLSENDYLYLCDENGNVESGSQCYEIRGMWEDLGLVAFTTYPVGSNNATVIFSDTQGTSFNQQGIYSYTFNRLNTDYYVKIIHIENTNKGFGDFVDDKVSSEPTAYEHATVSLITGTNANPGQYVSIGAIPGTSATNDTVCAVWYDKTNHVLWYSSNSSPMGHAGETDGTGWSTPVAIFADKDYENAGEYCKLAVDSYGGVHIAAYDPQNLDLVYAYLPANKKGAATSASDFATCIVDANGVVGSNLTLDVGKVSAAGNVIPYIGYYATSSIKPKIAYYLDGFASNSTEVSAGSDDDAYTGAWECATVPTSSTVEMQSLQHNDINIGLWKDNGVIVDSTSSKYTTGTSVTSNTFNSYDSDSYGQIYGNGTKNPVLGYAITWGDNSDHIETAQMK